MNGSAAPFLRVPIGDDAPRWSTIHGERTLVVAARTVTSTVRILETLPELLRGDSRVTVVFSHDPTSAFREGVLDLLRDAGCRIMPWGQLDAIAPDLILSASENIAPPNGRCPILVLPHGVGFHKHVPDSRGPRTRLSGAVSDPLLEADRVWLAISHPDQEAQLVAAQPRAAGRTLLVGDPCFDQLRASLPRADAYRRALGVADDQRLVVLSSTWGGTSLLGQHGDLPARLLAALPADAYRVAAIIHPNVWSGHDAWQIRTWQAAALDAGLLLIPPVHTWRAALVAADVIVGDHGSVTLYGASLGKPVLLAAFGTDAVPGTAVDRLKRLAPRLDTRAELRRQVEGAMAEHTPNRFAEVSASAFAEPGQALRRLRTAVYRLLRLAEPPGGSPPAVLALPRPDPPPGTVTSWMVATTMSERAGHLAIITHRYPAAVCTEGNDPGAVWHLACDQEEPDQRLTESASVLIRRDPCPAMVSARRWIRDTLERFPLSMIAAVPLVGGGTVLGLRDGRIVEAAATGSARDPGLPAAVAHACLCADVPLDGALLTLRTAGFGPGRAASGTREEVVALRVWPSRPAH